MSFPKKAVVSIDVSDISPLKSLQKIDFLNETDLHFVHAVRLVYYADFVSVPLVFPIDEDHAKISDAIVSFMKDSQKELIPIGHKAQITRHCWFDLDPKGKICDYAQDIDADLLVVGTRNRRGIFESSFANYLCRHSPTNLLIVREEQREKSNTVVVGINFDDEPSKYWENLKSWSFLNGKKVHIVHCSRVPKRYHYDPTLSLYPPSEKLVVLENSIQAKLESISTKILPSSEGVIAKCILSENPKKAFCEYAEWVNADLIILGTETKKMPFGSFIQYQCLHSSSSIMMLKNKLE